MNKHKISVIVADDHPIVAHGVSALLKAHQDIKVVAVCTSGTAALNAIGEQSPDVAVIDISMPDLNGLTLLSRLTRKMAARIIFLTAPATGTQVATAIARGAGGIVLKHGALDELVECVREVAAGRDCYPINLLNEEAERERRSDHDQTLTRREREVAGLVVEGLSNKEIGRRLDLTEGTVKSHLHKIYSKVGVANRTALAAVAIGQRELTSC